MLASSELLLWTLDEAQANCNPLNHFGEVRLPFESYSSFVFIPYDQFSTKTAPLKTYLDAHPDMAVFLVRIDCSETRHVLLAFENAQARADFLDAGDAIILKR